MEIDLAEGHEAALRMISSGLNRCPELTVIVLSGTADRCRHRRRVRQRRGCVRAEDVRPGRDRHGDPAGVRAVRLPGTAAGASGPDDGQPAARQADPPRARDPPARLGGRSNRQVAEILWVADQTVKFHLANIYRKLGVRSRFEAARWARESGILDVVVEPDSGEAMSEGSGNGGVSRALVPLREPADAAEGRYRKVRGNIAMTPNEYCRVRAPRH